LLDKQTDRHTYTMTAILQTTSSGEVTSNIIVAGTPHITLGMKRSDSDGQVA